MNKNSDMTITEFLEARIEEDESRAGNGWSTLGDTRWETDNYGRNFLTPSAVLAELKAKRGILDAYTGSPATFQILTHMASVYKDHPDYQKEWDDQ